MLMPSHQSIAELAYQLWLARGCTLGSADKDWFEAERHLGVTAEARRSQPITESEIDASLKESFPASDPPASHLPDVPPSNAADKWAAAGLKVREEAPAHS
jgi:hypothetical protein